MELIAFHEQMYTGTFRVPEGDRFTFSVLTRILGRECRLTVTDGNRLMICHSASPYPVWVWTPDDMTPEEQETAYLAMKTHFSGKGTVRWNVKHEFGEFLKKRGQRDGIPFATEIHMMAYNCPRVTPPQGICPGKLRVAEEGDIPLLVDYMDGFHREIGQDEKDRDAYWEKANALVRGSNLYVWETEAGIVSMCACQDTKEGTTHVSLVYTHPHHRRRGYAIHMMSQVTEGILARGLLPTLYTDRSYRASNACYTAIGYTPCGVLCTLRGEFV